MSGGMYWLNEAHDAGSGWEEVLQPDVHALFVSIHSLAQSLGGKLLYAVGGFAVRFRPVRRLALVLTSIRWTAYNPINNSLDNSVANQSHIVV